MVREVFGCGALRVRSEKYAGREAQLHFLEVMILSRRSEVAKGAAGHKGVPYECW
jgi:hypothetical protein